MNARAHARFRPLGRISATACVALFGLGLIAGAARAQGYSESDDLPARVGRVADLGGVVHHAPEDRASDWTPIGLNHPVTTGDNLWVGEGGRAEIDVGAGQIRLGGETNVHVSRLDDRAIAFFVAQGRAILRLRVLDPGEVARVDTPNTQITILRPGLYRVDVAPERTVLVVREGEATLPAPGGFQQVLPGQTAVAAGLDPARLSVHHGLATDGFDTWSANRDRRYERSRSATYVSPQMVGYADLDEYGRWESDTVYGAVWYPSLVDAGWAPYRAGHWTWVRGWGWTWVDDARWGYAPSHYGRWVYTGGRWGWCPGGYVARPYWAPAMVGWIGGAGWGLSLTAGAPVYGWVPLAWGEPFRPWWNNCSTRCWTWYNRPYAVRVTERPTSPPTRYENIRHPGGVTAVPGAAFTGAKPVREHLVAVRAESISGAPLLASAPGLARPEIRHVPGVKPGTGGVPPPASTFYATGRPGGATKPGAGPATSAAGTPMPGSMPGAVKPAPAGAVMSSPYPGSTKPAPVETMQGGGSVPRPIGGGQPVVRDTARSAPGSAASGASTGSAAPTGTPPVSIQGGYKPSPAGAPVTRSGSTGGGSGSGSATGGGTPAPRAIPAPVQPAAPAVVHAPAPKPSVQETVRREAPRAHERDGGRPDGGRNEKPGSSR